MKNHENFLIDKKNINLKKICKYTKISRKSYLKVLFKYNLIYIKFI